MKYSDLYHKLKSIFNLDKPMVYVEDSDMIIFSFEFSSDPAALTENLSSYYSKNSSIQDDNNILENNKFNYSVFLPNELAKEKTPIILLHGLNERSWLKYLPWAYTLAEKTGRAVILFPIAFHINRSPDSWGNPRLLQQQLSNRKQNTQPNSLSSFANVALSNRLSEQPIRFFTSGQQSSSDLIQLIKQIKNGEHPLIKSTNSPDFFAYSIGAFLAQILWIGNKDHLFDQSKLFLFCGGAFFSKMNGLSKLIMDKDAYEQIYHYYIDDFDKEIQNVGSLIRFFTENFIGKSFINMLGKEEYIETTKQRFIEMGDRVSAIALKNDRVIPASGIEEVIKNVTILDFDYPYTHETPFPIGNDGITQKVDDAFEQIFEKATQFFS